MKTRIPFTDRQLQHMADLYEAGSTISDIANKYGLSPFAVRARLLEMGVTFRRPGPKRKLRDPVAVERIMTLKSEGKTMGHIASILATSPTAIYRQLKRV